MKAIITSDWHLDAVTAGVRRFDELEAAVVETVDVAILQRVDLYAFLGDLCDPDSGSVVFRCAELALRVAKSLSRAGIPNVWMAGNHDVIEDGSGDTTLTPLRALGHLTHVVERPKMLPIAGAQWWWFPFTATAARYDPEEEAESGLRCLRNDGRHDRLYVAGHLSIPGMVPGEETLEFGRGREVMFPYVTLAAAPEVRMMFNGHYHESATHYPSLEGGGRGTRPILIPGSLARLTFGEENNRPCYMMVDDGA